MVCAQLQSAALLAALLTALAPGQEPGLEPLAAIQEPADLRNSALLPLAPPPLEKSLAQLDQWIQKQDWPLAGRLLQDLVRDRHRHLVRLDRRSATGFLEHLAARLLSAPPALAEELARLDAPDWARLWRPGLAHEARLATLLDLFPFQAADALLDLADLQLEAGRPRDALAVLARHRLLLPSRREAGFPAELARRRELALQMASTGPSQVPAARLRLEPLLLKLVEADPSGAEARWPERGLLEGRAEAVLAAGQLCLHDGKRLWRVQPDPPAALGEALHLASFLDLESPDWADALLPTAPRAQHLPRSLAAQGELLALVAGQRPEPAALPGRHGLFCLRLEPGDARPTLLWGHRGRFVGPLPEGLAAEDEQVLRRGPLSFGAGPVWVDQDLATLILAPLDKTRVTCFLARLEGRTGRPRWIRFLAQGAPEALDPLFDRLAAMPFPEVAGAPLCLLEGALFAASDLGTVHALEAWTGRPLWAVQTARTRPEAGKERGFLRSTLAGQGERVVAGLRDSEWIYPFLAFPGPGRSPLEDPPLPRRRLTWLVGLEGRHAYFTGAERTEYTLVRLSIPEGEWCESVPLPSGERFLGPPLLAGSEIIFSTERSLLRADLRRDLFLEDPLGERPEEAPRLLGPLLPWGAGLLSVGADGVGLWRPAP